MHRVFQVHGVRREREVQSMCDGSLEEVMSELSLKRQVAVSQEKRGGVEVL